MFMDLLTDSVKLRLRSDVPVGITLSDGIDSQAIAALSTGISETGTYSFNESDYAVKGTGVHSIYTPEDFIMDARRMMWHLEGPFGGVSTLAYAKLVSRMSPKVLLEGQGSDELMGGYAYHGIADNIRRAENGTEFLSDGCISERIEGAANPPTYPRPFTDDFSNNVYADTFYRKLPRVLRMNDRIAGSVGKEFREPYIDHRLVEFILSLPPDMRRKKRILRESMEGLVPESIRSADKQAITTPQQEWFRGPLKEYIVDTITSSRFRERGLFNSSVVESAFKRFCETKEKVNTFWIMQWINTDLFYRTFIEVE
jgi:asparagine synthase (glutamine-hydrolysing)